MEKYCVYAKKDAVSQNIKEVLKEKLCYEYDEVDPKYCIVVGGDGTFIRATHKYPNSIFFALHTGHLGFYSGYLMQDLDNLIIDLNQKKFEVTKLGVLVCKMIGKDKTLERFALNELTLITPPRTLILDIFIDDKLLETFRGTGVCVSTTSGSTAYNKSLHGAVVDSCLETMQITEIAGLNSNAYKTLASSLLLSKNRRITLKTKRPQELHITIDNLSFHFYDFEAAEVTLNSQKISLAQTKKPDFVERIRRTFLD